MRGAGGPLRQPERPFMRDRLGAFVPHVDVIIQGAPTGPLADLTFAAKDLFDVRGTVTGNPDWEATHPPATRSACSALTASSARRCTPGRPIWCPAAPPTGLPRRSRRAGGYGARHRPRRLRAHPVQLLRPARAAANPRRHFCRWHGHPVAQLRHRRVLRTRRRPPSELVPGNGTGGVVGRAPFCRDRRSG